MDHYFGIKPQEPLNSEPANNQSADLMEVEHVPPSEIISVELDTNNTGAVSDENSYGPSINVQISNVAPNLTTANTESSNIIADDQVSPAVPSNTQNTITLPSNGAANRIDPSVQENADINSQAGVLPKEQSRNSRSQSEDSKTLKKQVSRQRNRTVSRRRESIASSQQPNESPGSSNSVNNK